MSGYQRNFSIFKFFIHMIVVGLDWDLPVDCKCLMLMQCVFNKHKTCVLSSYCRIMALVAEDKCEGHYLLFFFAFYLKLLQFSISHSCPVTKVAAGI